MHRLTGETRSAVDAYWAAFFGCAPEALRRAESHVVAHVGLGDYRGAYAMTFGDAAPIVSVPPAFLDLARSAASRWNAGTVNSPADLRALLGARAGDAIGPAVVSYVDSTPDHRIASDNDVRVLLPSEAAHRTAVEQLCTACTPTEWAHGGSGLTDTPAVGVFHEGFLVSMASYNVWGERLAHIAIVTHPNFRGRGFGRAAVARLTAYLGNQGLIPQYRTLAANVAALRVATSLGFVPYARSMAVRLHTETA
jgi:RimJ/RimL family protein N-acetyltransferase